MHPILLRIGSVRIYSYGVLIALGGLVSGRFWYVRRQRMGIAAEEDFWLLLNVILLGGFVGGRALYLIEYTRLFSADFWKTFFSLSRGYSVLGAFAGVLGGLWWFSRRVGAPLSRVLDYVCQAAPVWHAFGRLGCFAAGCCYGLPTSMPWGVTFTDPRAMIDPRLLGRPVHPTQLYEALGELVIAALLYRFVLRAVEEGRQPAGSVAAAYFVGYACLRFVVEFFRGDTVALAWLGLTAAQGLCLLLAASALAFHVHNRRNFKSPCTRS
ncbi:MAG: prolipoprotein diacylglyceryl transferase [Elusimicrobia bacterium]|nr:prolipoprotein diacylglyceryl transferase [Elusimicrobiota bacterium]MDE2237466.1 prolipoprotein diacylglyceryl transferase [Elusimicrobiota bacterium]MDE2424662.1 prolipoprotein diacylglyceryl transferase [Elusimicrobiota bacterium]